jgi:competence protein ComEA
MSATSTPTETQQSPSASLPNSPPAAPAGSVTGRFHALSYLLGLLTALLLVGGTLFALRRPELQPIQLHLPPKPAPTGTASPTPTPGPIVIFVSGAVQQPGLYTLAPGARVGDAIALAGGLAASADPALVNQAQVLYDGAQVHVPAAIVADVVAGPHDGAEASVPVVMPAKVAPPAGLSGALPTPTRSPAGAATISSAGGLININTASVEQLDTLPGIGPSRAQGIIDGRPYQTVDDLDRIPGIGTTTLERLRALVTVGP